MMKITYEDFKRINNNLKTRYTTADQADRIVKIVGVSQQQGLVKLQGKNGEFTETIGNLVSLVCKNMTAVNNPSAIQSWKGFLNESNTINIDQKQKMQNILIMTILNNLCDSPETFLAVASLKLNFDKEDIKRMKQGTLPKYNEAMYHNAIKYILSCRCEEVNQMLIRQGIVLSN